MNEFTRPATWEDVLNVVSLLQKYDVKYAIIGGYGLAVHGIQRFTEDLDILVDPTPANTARWIDALRQLPDRACEELVGEDDLFEQMGPYALRINDDITIDVMPTACGHDWNELSQYLQIVTVDGVAITTLSLQGLLLTKEGIRPRDKADTNMIHRVLKQCDTTADDT